MTQKCPKSSKRNMSVKKSAQKVPEILGGGLTWFEKYQNQRCPIFYGFPYLQICLHPLALTYLRLKRVC